MLFLFHFFTLDILWCERRPLLQSQFDQNHLYKAGSRVPLRQEEQPSAGLALVCLKRTNSIVVLARKLRHESNIYSSHSVKHLMVRLGKKGNIFFNLLSLFVLAFNPKKKKTISAAK